MGVFAIPVVAAALMKCIFPAKAGFAFSEEFDAHVDGLAFDTANVVSKSAKNKQQTKTLSSKRHPSLNGLSTKKISAAVTNLNFRKSRTGPAV